MAKTLALALHSQAMSLDDDDGLESLLFPASSGPIPSHTLITVAECSCLVQSPWCFSRLSARLFSGPWPGPFFLLPVGGLSPEEQSRVSPVSWLQPGSALHLGPFLCCSVKPGIDRSIRAWGSFSAFLANGYVCLPLILSRRAH